MLLAHTQPGFQEACLRRPLTLEPEGERLEPEALREQLELVRRTGAARMTRTRPEPATSVAAPILDGQRRVVAALSVVGTDGSLDPRMLEPAVIAIAASISREVGQAARTPRETTTQ